jgi:putative N6-adenine-specific DNA methylase
MTKRACFAVVTPGFEGVAEAELRALGVDDVVAEEGGVSFTATDAGLFRANLWLRSAARVIVRVAEFPARTFADLERRAKRVEWARYATGGQVAFRVTCRKSRLYHSDAVAERLARSIEAQVPGVAVVRPGAEDADDGSRQLFVVRMLHDVCTISADASGALLHRRGYRLATAKAPIRENIAAGCLLALGYEGTAALVDPMCGSGTIPIEAAMIAAGIAPGRARTFACERWPGFDAKAVAAARAAVQRPIATGSTAGESGVNVPIIASDRDAGAVQATVANAERAGVGGMIEVSRRAFSTIDAPAQRGLLIANPPYGARVKGGADLRNLYAQMGNVAREKFAGWRVALVVADKALAGQTKLPFEEVLAFSNGGIKVRLVATPTL